MDFKNTVIAISTDNGITVSSHFGCARFYEVTNLFDVKVVKREWREKAGHHFFGPAKSEHGHHSGEAHGYRLPSIVM